jgi:hypothetical protein
MTATRKIRVRFKKTAPAASSDSAFKEGDHPRAENGQFGSGGSSNLPASPAGENHGKGVVTKVTSQKLHSDVRGFIGQASSKYSPSQKIDRSTYDLRDYGAFYGMMTAKNEAAKEIAAHLESLGYSVDASGADRGFLKVAKKMHQKPVAKADAEHWITLHPNGKEAKGTPALINGAGQIIGGAGGKLTGKVVNPTSKSEPKPGTEKQHAPAIWLGPAKAEEPGKGGEVSAQPPAEQPPVEAPKPPETETPAETPKQGGGDDPELTKMESDLAKAKDILEKASGYPEFMRKEMEAEIARKQAEIDAHKAKKQGGDISPRTGKPRFQPAPTPAAAQAPVEQQTPPEVATEPPKVAEPPAAEPAPAEPPAASQAVEKSPLERKIEEARSLGEGAKTVAEHRSAEVALRAAAQEAYTQQGLDKETLAELRKTASDLDNQANEQRKLWHKKISEDALALSETAKTKEEHLAAMAAHEAAYKAHQYTSMRNVHARAYHEHKKAAAKFDAADRRAATAKQRKIEKETGELSATRQAETKFKSSSLDDVRKSFGERFGVSFGHPEGAQAEHAAVSKMLNSAAYKKMSPEDRTALHAKYTQTLNAARAGGYNPPSLPRGAKHIDINDGSKAAKDMRKMLGHYDATFTDLESAGFDIKAALSGSNVQIVSTSAKNSNGVMWQDARGGKNCVAISLTNRIEGAKMRERMAEAKRRREAGEPRWSISGESENPTRATIVHEVAHAIGLHGNRKSDQRLDGILKQLFPNFGDRQTWLRDNVSKYSTTNIRETDAEIAAMVLEPSYVRGTLPKELEDHVDWLFMKKGA